MTNETRTMQSDDDESTESADDDDAGGLPMWADGDETQADPVGGWAGDDVPELALEAPAGRLRFGDATAPAASRRGTGRGFGDASDASRDPKD